MDGWCHLISSFRSRRQFQSPPPGHAAYLRDGSGPSWPDWMFTAWVRYSPGVVLIMDRWMDGWMGAVSPDRHSVLESVCSWRSMEGASCVLQVLERAGVHSILEQHKRPV